MEGELPDLPVARSPYRHLELSRQIPLQTLPNLHQINTPTQSDVINKLIKVTQEPTIQIINEDIKQDWPQYTESWGTPLVTGHRQDVSPCTTSLWVCPSSHY
ncbi:hypothetical protein TURU_121869 [Turdus rufiventris]|nr:hypothetical protein TURU_121869 [Turdus rufiventris]